MQWITIPRSDGVKHQIHSPTLYIHELQSVLNQISHLVHVLNQCFKHCIGLVHVSDSAALPFTSIREYLKRIEGQGYDGASNTQSKFNGLNMK